MKTIQRAVLRAVLQRLREPRRFLTVLAGPRQVGKTTLVRQALAELAYPSRYASADDPGLRDRLWLDTQWQEGRRLARQGAAVLAIDEAQKIEGWSDVVKRLWDEDSASGVDLRVILLGSAPLLIQRGLTESLAGRFEIVRAAHWSLAEMQAAFGWDVDTFVLHGGYPGAAPLVADSERWGAYVRDSLIETTVSRDVLLMTRVDKPALLRRMLDLACRHSGEILSYTKMIGQLQDAGNTTTLAHYLDLLGGVGMAAGLQNLAGQPVRQRASSPKLQVWNTALVTALSGRSPEAMRADTERWGRLVESAVGAHLLNTMAGTGVEVLYWRERNREVDFVLRRGERLVGIEVKSGRKRSALPGLGAFRDAWRPDRLVTVGAGGIGLAEALAWGVEAWF